MNPLAFLNTVTAPARNAALQSGRQFFRNQIAGAVRNTGLNTYRTLQTGAPLPAALSSVKLSANTPVFRGTVVGLTPIAAVDASNKSGFTGQIEGALNKFGPALDQFFSGTPQAIQQFGREQEKKGWGGALEMASPFGFLAAPFIPNSATATPAPVKPRPIASLPADYKKTELQAGAAAEAFRPGAGFPGQQAAADRAYEQEKSRVAQLAAQDELSKKYNVADLTKAYNTASTPEEKEKIGLQIWATTNPQLAQKLKPGQLGYQETQAAVAAQSPMGGAMRAVGDMQYTDKISFGEVPATNFGIGLQTPLSGMQVPSIPQVGVAEAFKGTTPGGVSFTEAAELFKPEALSQTQQALLKQAFEKGLKK